MILCEFLSTVRQMPELTWSEKSLKSHHPLQDRRRQ